MAVLRQFNAIGQERLDVQHVQLMEQSVAGDFDALCGRIFVGGVPTVIRGFTILGVSGPASGLQVRVAGGALLHPTASDAGTVYTVPDSEADEPLRATNSHVEGSFAANSINYVGVDLVREADDATADVVQVLSTVTGQDSPRTVPLARILRRRFVVSTMDPASTPNLAPIAKVTTDASNNVTAIVDIRNLYLRLGSGGSAPNQLHTYPWGAGRVDRADFQSTGGDRQLGSEKDWKDAVMTRLWELGGGERWFSATADRNVILTGTGAPFTGTTGEYFEWTGTNVHWQGLSIAFDNSTGIVNDIKDQATNLAGLTDLADGDCIYVDLDRSVTRTGGTALQPVKAPLATLGQPLVPGGRWVLVWRKGSNIYQRGKIAPVGAFAFLAATTSVLGGVLLSGTPSSSVSPIVATLNSFSAAMAAGLSRQGYTGGAGSLSLGGGNNDTGMSYGNAAMVDGHTFLYACDTSLAGKGVEFRNSTDAATTPSTRPFTCFQQHSGTMKEAVGLDSAGAIRMPVAFFTPLTPGSTFAKIFMQSNGVASPNTQLSMWVLWPTGNMTKIAQSDLF